MKITEDNIRAAGKTLLLSTFALVCGCASIPESKQPVPAQEHTVGALPAEISATTPRGEFTWRGHNYSFERMRAAIRAAKHSEGITSVVLLEDQKATVKDILDVTLIAGAADLPAFYRQGDKLVPIKIER